MLEIQTRKECKRDNEITPEKQQGILMRWGKKKTTDYMKHDSAVFR